MLSACLLTKNTFYLLNYVSWPLSVDTSSIWPQMRPFSSYANLLMDRFEAKALVGFPQKPLTWKWFIDDIFLVWTHGEESLKKFIDYLNSLHDTIKFTHEMSYTNIDFLDTAVKFSHNRGLITTLFSKPTDTHLYLEYSSAHPQSVLTKGPFGQYLRLRRICTVDCDFEANAKKTHQVLSQKRIPI